jgi:lambda family phage minor tail protein L
VYPSGDIACPYTGGATYDINGNPVADPRLDVASKRVTTCCKPRFGASATLPFGGFPGVSRVR